MIDLTGQRFGLLLVLSEGSRSACNKRRWLCRCDCGQEPLVDQGNLRVGQSRSCGCASIERFKRSRLKHGHTSRRGASPEYRAWQNMKSRCLDPANTAYKNYGHRGITVCDQWLSFDQFLQDMGSRPSPLHTLERIDNNAGYAAANCRWATRKEQNLNKRSNHHVTIDGVTLTISQWEAKFGLPHHLLERRLAADWKGADAIRCPHGPRRYSFNGYNETLAEWSARLGIRHSTLQQRIQKLGWPIERALSTPLQREGKRKPAI